ncbi:hypothetical protein QAD02_004531 [Eretmocerus hayati]|uniref:Uncharacterized protein n=1 Tax=Eretmocerus hayati TaxID=131215 RepID=A0ACC2NPT1_9HYME|nr:hypothetical protein QAD02_004531 [Eretmocerus hayati]
MGGAHRTRSLNQILKRAKRAQENADRKRAGELHNLETEIETAVNQQNLNEAKLSVIAKELEDAIDLSQRSHRAILHCHSKVEEGSRDVDYWLDLADAQLKIYSQLDLEPYRQRLKEALKEYEESLAATKALAEHYQLTVDRHREERMRVSLRQQLQMELDALNEKSLSQ